MIPFTFYLCISILLLSGAFGIIVFRKLSLFGKVLCGLIVYTAIHECICYFTDITFKSALYWLYANIKIPCYLVLLSLVSQLGTTKYLLRILSIVLSIVTVIITLKIGETENFPAIPESIAAPVTIICCFLIYYELITRVESTHIIRNVKFVFSSLLLVYLSINFFQLALVTVLKRNNMLRPLWANYVHMISSILFYSGLLYLIVLDLRNNRAIKHT